MTNNWWKPRFNSHRGADWLIFPSFLTVWCISSGDPSELVQNPAAELRAGPGAGTWRRDGGLAARPRRLADFGHQRRLPARRQDLPGKHGPALPARAGGGWELMMDCGPFVCLWLDSRWRCWIFFIYVYLKVFSWVSSVRHLDDYILEIDMIPVRKCTVYNRWYFLCQIKRPFIIFVYRIWTLLN